MICLLSLLLFMGWFFIVELSNHDALFFIMIMLLKLLYLLLVLILLLLIMLGCIINL